MKIKHIIKRSLESINIGIYRISKNPDGVPSHEIPDPFAHIDPLVHNTKENFDRNACKETTLKEYLTEGRMQFYRDVIAFSVENGMIFDDKDILDAGCNANCLLENISKEFNPKSLIGYDYSAETLEIAKSISPASKYKVFDLVHDNATDQFDVIFCTQVIEHIPDAELAVKKLVELAKPNAHILITVPDGRIDQFRGHIHFWSPESFKIFIRKTLVDTDSDLVFGNNFIGNFALIKLK